MYAETLQRGLFDDEQTNNPESLCVIGVGDAGCRAAFEVRAGTLHGTRWGIKVVCVDTDSTSLTRSSADHSVLLGAATLRGFGSGGDPAAAAEALENSADTIRGLVSGAECVLILAGLGGGTGAGAAPVIASIARDAGALVTSVAIMPFDFEGIRTHIQAYDSLDRLKLVADVVLETSSGGHTAGGSTLSSAMGSVRRSVAEFASALVSIVATNIDYSGVTAAHLRSVLRDGASAVFGTAEENGDIASVEIAKSCVSAALADRLATGEIDRAIILIESGPELPVAHVAAVMATLEDRLAEARLGAAPELHLGIRRSKLLAGKFRVSLVGTLREVKRPLIVRIPRPTSVNTTDRTNPSTPEAALM